MSATSATSKTPLEITRPARNESQALATSKTPLKGLEISAGDKAYATIASEVVILKAGESLGWGSSGEDPISSCRLRVLCCSLRVLCYTRRTRTHHWAQLGVV